MFAVSSSVSPSVSPTFAFIFLPVISLPLYIVVIGIIEFISAAVDMNIYNVMFFFSIENQLMIGNIVTQNKYKNRIAQIAKETIDSLEIYEEEENTDGNNNVSES